MRRVIFLLILFFLFSGSVASAALVDNGDGTVTDTGSGLMWQKATALGLYTWQQAFAYCENLSFAGHADWRLPNRNELHSLLDYSRYDPATDPLLSAHPMSSTCWSSTTDADDTKSAWIVAFYNGYGNNSLKSNNYYVRAVRGGQSGSFGNLVILRGVAVGRDSHGAPLNPLSGATAEIPGSGTKITDSQGAFRFDNLRSGTYTVSVSKDGYYPVTRQITLNSGDTKQEVFDLMVQQVNAPVAFGFQSPSGKHFIEGMPGNLAFEATIAWNGLPGTVRFLVGGEWHNAMTQDIGGGLARASISIQIPTILNSISELKIEVTNSEGQTTISATGVFFYPVPKLLSQISAILPSWNLTGTTYSSDTEISRRFWHKEIPSGVLESEAALGYHQKFAFDTLSGALVIGLNGFVEGSTTLQFADVENLSGSRADFTETGTFLFRGEAAPKIQGNIEIAGTFKSGFGAPAVYTLKLFPPAAPFVDTLLTVPVVKDVLKALKLRFYFIGGLGLNGTWGEKQNCLLGTETIGGSFTLGAEIQALIDKWGAELGVYAGGTGTPDFDLCPQFSFNGVTIRGYMGVFANTTLFNFTQEFGYEMELGEGESDSASSPQFKIVPLASTAKGWQPIGKSLLKWGTPNRLPRPEHILSMSRKPLDETLPDKEEKLLENVVGLASPSVVADSNQTRILFTLQDTNKPWHSATDIAQVIIPKDSSANIENVTDDLAAEFSPKLIEIDTDTMLGAWTRVAGDVSQTESPEQVFPHMEIVAAHYKRSNSSWGPVFRLTDNDVNDRDPLPVSFGGNQGVLWVQNQGGADSLLYGAWTGSAWTAPIVLWAGQKSLMDFAFIADGTGQGHVVFSVDEDSDTDTRGDRELYHIQTMDSIWQPATRITDNSLEDAIPILMAPAGIPLCVWRQAEDLVYAKVGDWNQKTVYPRYTSSNATPSLTGTTLPGGAAIAYTVQGPQGIDIYAAFYDALLDRWSLPRQLTHDEHAESALALDFDGTELVVAYLKTITERSARDVEIDGQIHHIENVPQPGRTDLYVLKHRLGYDLAVLAENVSFEPENPTPGNSAKILVTIENRGDLPVGNVTTRFYLGDPDKGGTLINEVVTTEPLIPGDSCSVQTTWPISEDPATQSITIVVDPALSIDDRDRSNNSAYVSACKPDITIVRAISNATGLSTRLITVSVTNKGTVPAVNVPVMLTREGSPEQVLYQASIDTLPVGATHDLIFEWDTTGEEPDNGYLLLKAIANAAKSIDEFTYTNNTQLIQVQGAIPDKAVNPSISSGATDVSSLPTFDWEDSTAATGYNILIWKASEAKPNVPTASGLAESKYTPLKPLEPSTEYRWQVVAVNEAGISVGDEWSFTTKNALPGDINNDGAVNLTDAILACKVLTRFETERTVYDAAAVSSDGKISLAEVIYILQKVTGMR